ncbi:unnamed protein product [Rangifer tarandus platyrhynchus]|uniref:Uncharacterized protein n=1 Tax=Rangifer tarandus platyrhynchus TaxID=3082113 RepID=A0ABN8ZT70_RANTA|nr:unnamed protein product [Rangifer tarandus platyrhynchus]
MWGRATFLALSNYKAAPAPERAGGPGRESPRLEAAPRRSAPASSERFLGEEALFLHLLSLRGERLQRLGRRSKASEATALVRRSSGVVRASLSLPAFSRGSPARTGSPGLLARLRPAFPAVCTHNRAAHSASPPSRRRADTTPPSPQTRTRARKGQGAARGGGGGARRAGAAVPSLQAPLPRAGATIAVRVGLGGMGPAVADVMRVVVLPFLQVPPSSLPPSAATEHPPSSAPAAPAAAGGVKGPRRHV